MSPEREASYRAGLAAAVDAGYAVLERGGSSLDAVNAAVRMMEDDPQFNAGRGAALTTMATRSSTRPSWTAAARAPAPWPGYGT